MIRKVYYIFLIIVSMATYDRVAASISVIGSLTREYTVKPGDRVQGTITIQNNGETSADAKIYQTDYMFFCDGHSEYGDPGKKRRSNASWIRYSPTYVTVPAKEKLVVNYTITIPQSDTLRGTYWSIIMIEQVPEIKPEAEQEGISIKAIMRYGVQMITHLGDSGVRNLRFIGSRLINEDGKRIFLVDIENTGERLLRPFVWVELYDFNGKMVGRYDGRKLRTYPGTSIRQRIDLSDVPKGRYKALVVADCGNEDIFGITYEFAIQ